MSLLHHSLEKTHSWEKPCKIRGEHKIETKKIMIWLINILELAKNI